MAGGGIATCRVLIDQRPDAGGSHAEQFAHARRPYIARAPHPEQQVVEKTGRAAEFPRPDSANVAVVGLARGAIQNELDSVRVDPWRGALAEQFLATDSTTTTGHTTVR